MSQTRKACTGHLFLYIFIHLQNNNLAALFSMKNSIEKQKQKIKLKKSIKSLEINHKNHHERNRKMFELQLYFRSLCKNWNYL